MKNPFKKQELRRRRLVVAERRIETLGQSDEFWADLYHRAMLVSLPIFMAAAASLFVLNNLFFAALFWLQSDAIANVQPPLFLHLFFFSIENFTTVGFGYMHPQTVYGHVIASFEGFAALVQTAGLTGLIFARFSRPRSRIMFADAPVIALHDGMPTLMIRVANERHNIITDATAVLWILRTEISREGQRFRRLHRLPLLRDENPSFVLTWTLFHPIGSDSLLFDRSAEDLARDDIQFILTVKGIDETSLQELRSRKIYTANQLRWNERYIDMLSTLQDGSVLLDYTKFNQTVQDNSDETG